MRVLQLGKFYPPHSGGMETHLEALCQLLRDRVELRVIVANERRDTVAATLDGVHVTRVGTLARVSSTSISPGLTEYIRTCTADIVHLHCPNPWAAIAYLRSGHRGKLIVTYHSDVIRQRYLGKIVEPITKRLLDQAAAIVTASENYIATSDVLQSYRQRCHVIPFGIAPDIFEHEPESAAVIRRQFGSPLILSIGRLVYYKGFTYLLEAMKSIQGKLLIIGDGPLRQDLLRQIERDHLKDRVFLLGGVENIAPYYHAADIFVLASNARSEAFGIVQLEAMAAGKPVINTALDTGVPFVSLHGRTGLTVPPSNSEALAWAMSLLLNDPDLRLRYGQAARERVRQEFCLTEMGERTYQLYQSILGIRDDSVLANSLIALSKRSAHAEIREETSTYEPK